MFSAVYQIIAMENKIFIPPRMSNRSPVRVFSAVWYIEHGKQVAVTTELANFTFVVLFFVDAFSIAFLRIPEKINKIQELHHKTLSIYFVNQSFFPFNIPVYECRPNIHSKFVVN